MSLAEIRSAIREAFGIIPTLDLHGLGVKEARREIGQFLRDAYEHGVGSVRVVYGKGRGSPGGRGVLREVILRWLDTDGRELVRRYERKLDSAGEDGSVIVWLRPQDVEEED